MKKNLTTGLLLILSVVLVFTIAIAKKSQHAWIGVATQTVDENIADAFDLSVEYGAIINEVVDDSPADKAGLTDGDVIIAYNSEKVYDYDDLIDYLEDSSPDESITITIMRDDSKMNIDITLGKASKRTLRKLRNNRNFWGNHGIINIPAMPAMPDLPAIPDIGYIQDLRGHGNNHSYNYNFSFDNSAYIGVQLSELSDQLREYFGIREDVGVLVTEVEEDSPANKAGILAGDIIIKADKDEIEDYRDLKESLEDKEDGDILSITLIRDKNKKQIDVTVAEREIENQMYFNSPDISIQVPHGKSNHTFFSGDFDKFFDSDEFEDEMKELQKELEELKFEMNKEVYKEFNSKEFKREMKKFKKEMKENENIINKELKSELEKLKLEFKELEKRIDD